MLSPEDKALHVARHKALEADVSRTRKPKSEGHYEAMWERTLGEVTGGRYDMVIGLRFLVAELQQANSKQAFIDAAALKIIGELGDAENNQRFAKEAYDAAEALWTERERRRQGIPYDPRKPEEIPF